MPLAGVARNISFSCLSLSVGLQQVLLMSLDTISEVWIQKNLPEANFFYQFSVFLFAYFDIYSIFIMEYFSPVLILSQKKTKP